MICLRDTRGLEEEQNVLLTHGDSVSNVAPGFDVIATAGDTVAGAVPSLPSHLYFSCTVPITINQG